MTARHAHLHEVQPAQEAAHVAALEPRARVPEGKRARLGGATRAQQNAERRECHVVYGQNPQRRIAEMRVERQEEEQPRREREPDDLDVRRAACRTCEA